MRRYPKIYHGYNTCGNQKILNSSVNVQSGKQLWCVDHLVAPGVDEDIAKGVDGDGDGHVREGVEVVPGG